jgi:protein gp37
MEKKAAALGRPSRTSGIEWTEATWNPLQGCTYCSEGCNECYAAKLLATRLADKFPGVAKKVVKNGEAHYVFTGKIILLPEKLGEPLLDRVPKRYFVNSLSDLFHKHVPDEFIAAVFCVMETASWHTFQVLSKRPERMARFTQEYYGDREPASNVWLGTSTEDQKSYDERRPHLLATKAAVRWLSCEPLIGPIALGDPTGIDWVVTGGESGSDRRMEKEWAVSLRDQCEKAKLAFFFKQWGDFNEEGVKAKKLKKDRLTPPTLDGVVYNEYPA